VFHSSFSAEPLQLVARDTALVYHICITVDRIEDKAKSAKRTFARVRTHHQPVIQECDTWPGNLHP
jgi:hypothetical protein